MACYAVTSILTYTSSQRLLGAEQLAWRFAVFVMVFQFANTPLDLHGLAWASARCLAHIQGWYAERHLFQRNILLALILATAALVFFAMALLRRNFLRNLLLVLGVGLSLGMTMAKGVNYHYLEVFYSARFGPLATADLVELFGIALVLFATQLKPRVRTHKRA